jgi:hypothetical protein
VRVFSDLLVGNHLKIHARATGANTALATEIEQITASSSVTIQGSVQSASDPVLTIMGASINTAGLPDSGFKGRYGATGRTAFFNSVSGQIVSLQGTASGNTVTWQSAALED